ncbi:hypothetical protein FBU31_001926, partial [Coemansia sp. 'formosensis']
MDGANRLSRKATELEQKLEWAEAAVVHRRAAIAYSDIKTFDYDPVATLSLFSLVNKHRRWAEYCDQKSEVLNTAAQSQSYEADDLESDSRTSGADQLRRSQNNNDEHEFEDFWQYMQRWLANPTAFTRPTLPSSSRGARIGSSLGDQIAGPNITESFYLVGSNPEQSASIYGAATAKAMATPLQALDEVDEPDEENGS